MKAVTTKSIKTKNAITKVPNPKLHNNEVLVKIHATGVNHVDLSWANNTSLSTKDQIFGLEMAGEVVDPNNTNFKVGQRVAALMNNGGYAEYAAVDKDRLIILPTDFSYEEGASFPESFMTAYQTLFWIGKLRENQTVLIHAGASNVGSIATKLAKTITGVKVITTSSSKKTPLCIANGADYAIDYSKQNFIDEVNSITNGKGVDLILDFIGADYFHDNIKSLAKDAKLVLIGTLSGSKLNSLDLRPIMFKRITITGTVLSSRSNEYKARLTSQLNKYLVNHDKETILPKISKVFKLADSLKAQDYLRAKKNIGKVIIDIDK